ncbi:response regulator transcription factor [Trichocoleus sp. FACHB-6]|nr:response regulator transcription factor [Trichocoleus sp. FACHB-832]MBD2062935.1 response regulator transcription factor [Trichocoleus sp. FACHB-6]
MATWQSFRQRDRDITNRLMISESTVKFHINNILKKLKTQTRY